MERFIGGDSPGSNIPLHLPPVEDLARDLYPGQRQAAVYR